MLMPISWIEKILDRMATTYGTEFARKWNGVDSAAMKATWARELDNFVMHPQAIAWALDHLPEYPPNVIQFRNLARSAPGGIGMAPAITNDVPAKPEVVNAELAKIGETIVAGKTTDPRAWAHRILAAVEAGEIRSSISVRMARQALGLPVEQQQ